MKKTIRLGYAPTRRSIFSAPDAVKYRNLTADRLREMGVAVMPGVELGVGHAFDDHAQAFLAERLLVVDDGQGDRKSVV